MTIVTKQSAISASISKNPQARIEVRQVSYKRLKHQPPCSAQPSSYPYPRQSLQHNSSHHDSLTASPLTLSLPTPTIQHPSNNPLQISHYLHLQPSERCIILPSIVSAVPSRPTIGTAVINITNLLATDIATAPDRNLCTGRVTYTIHGPHDREI